MTRLTSDKCRTCGRNGLSDLEKDASGRRRCRLCRAVELRSYDRHLYLACECELGGCEEKGWALGGWWSAEPFFERFGAENYLAEVRDARDARAPGRYRYAPFTVAGRVGVLAYSPSGPRFMFVMEKIVDASLILSDVAG